MDDPLFVARRAFIERTDKRSIKMQIQEYIKKAKDECQINLEKRRAKLKYLIKEEDRRYFAEYEGNVKSSVEENVKKRQEFLLNLKKIKAKEEEDFVKNRTLHNFFSYCDMIRTEIVKQNAKSMTMTRLAQMEERKLLNQNERDEECFYVQSEDLYRSFDDHNEQRIACCQKVMSCESGKEHLEGIKKNAEVLRKSKEAEALKRKQRIEKERADAVIQRGDDLKRKEELMARNLQETMEAKEQRDFLEKSKKEFDEYYQNLLLCDIAKDECSKEDNSRAQHLSNEEFKTYMKHVKEDVRSRDKKTDDIMEAERNRIICKRAYERKPRAFMTRDPPPKSGICETRDVCKSTNLVEANRCAELYATSLPMKSPRKIDKYQSQQQWMAELDKQVAEAMSYKKKIQKDLQREHRIMIEDASRCHKVLEANKHTRLDNRPVHPNWAYLDCKCGDSQNFIMPNINYTKQKLSAVHN
ncbi:hypothetical protein ACFFRR_002926 [Megaselia abdita]